MNGRRSITSILAVAVVAGAIGVGAAVTGGEPQWRKALEVRSEALNRQHGLDQVVRSSPHSAPALNGPYSFPRTTSFTDPWLRALMIRSEALNRQHGLGRYARNPASATAPQWLQALMIRSDALNREYKLGEYAPGP